MNDEENRNTRDEEGRNELKRKKKKVTGKIFKKESETEGMGYDA